MYRSLKSWLNKDASGQFERAEFLANDLPLVLSTTFGLPNNCPDHSPGVFAHYASVGKFIREIVLPRVGATADPIFVWFASHGSMEPCPGERPDDVHMGRYSGL